MKNKYGPRNAKSNVSETTEIGKLISNFRVKNNITLKELSKKLGTNIQQLSNIEHGRAPFPVKYLNKLNEITNVSMYDLTIMVLQSKKTGLKHLVEYI